MKPKLETSPNMHLAMTNMFLKQWISCPLISISFIDRSMGKFSLKCIFLVIKLKKFKFLRGFLHSTCFDNRTFLLLNHSKELYI